MSNFSAVPDPPLAERRYHPFFTYWLPWLLWMGLIFLLSDQPKDESMRTSGWFLWIFEWLGMTPAEMEAYYLPFLIRKAAHFTVYLVLGWWSIRLECHYRPGQTWPWRALLWCVLYAISDEWHQTYVPGRGPAATDVLIDSLGAFAALGLWRVYEKKYIYRIVDHKM